MGKGKYETTVFDRARDELFSHIQRCGVLDADDEHRGEWLKDTTDYLRERYPELDRGQLDELTEIGDRYCQPAIRHVEADEETPEESGEASDAEVKADSPDAEVKAGSPDAEVKAGSPDAETEADSPSAETEADSSGSEAGEEKEVSVA